MLSFFIEIQFVSCEQIQNGFFSNIRPSTCHLVRYYKTLKKKLSILLNLRNEQLLGIFLFFFF